MTERKLDNDLIQRCDRISFELATELGANLSQEVLDEALGDVDVEIDCEGDVDLGCLSQDIQRSISKDGNPTGCLQTISDLIDRETS